MQATVAGEFVLELEPEERKQLLELLERSLQQTLIEEHRTDALNYRQHIVQREQVILKILTKLKTTGTGAERIAR